MEKARKEDTRNKITHTHTEKNKQTNRQRKKQLDFKKTQLDFSDISAAFVIEIYLHSLLYLVDIIQKKK